METIQSTFCGFVKKQKRELMNTAFLE